VKMAGVHKVKFYYILQATQYFFIYLMFKVAESHNN
jgi:hypothetical protein